MTRLVLADLMLNVRVWVGLLLVTTAAGFIASLAAGLLETGAAYGGVRQEMLESATSAVVVFSVITALIVLSATANLTVALQQRGYALWQLVGIRPALVGSVVVGQLVVVALIGGALGAAIAIPAFAPIFGYLFGSWEMLGDITVHLGGGSMTLATLGIAAVVLLGGLGGARRASRVAPIEALREPDPPQTRMTWLRLLIAAGAVTATVFLVRALFEGDFQVSASQAILLTPLIAAAFAAVGPLLLSAVLRGWTAIVPARASASWFLARHSARYRVSQSTAAISPLMVAIALTGGLYTTTSTLSAASEARGLGAWSSLDAPTVVMILGGPLLLSAIGAAATVYMSGQSREREFALLQAAGATRERVVLTAVWEAVIYTVTAVLLGLGATVIGGVLLAGAVEQPFPEIALVPIGVIAGAGAVLVLAATVIPTVIGLRHEIPRVLAVE